MRIFPITLAALAVLATLPAARADTPPAAPDATPTVAPSADKDWPCQQRLVPTLTAGLYWTAGQVPQPAANWGEDPKIGPLVNAVASRTTTIDDGVAKLNAFADSLPQDQRATVLPQVFADIVQSVNDERHHLIGTIEDIGRRQKSIAKLADTVSDELDNIPEPALGTDNPKRDEVVQRRDMLLRDFQETQKTMQYICAVPQTLERRLGAYATALQAKLK